METLVLKCAEVAMNPSLRGMNELRFKINKAASGNPVTQLAKIRNGNFNDTNTDTPYWEIIEGTGIFTNSSGSADYGTSREGTAVYVKLTSSIITVRVKNFTLSCNSLGYGTTNSNAFGSTYDSSKNLIEISLDELNNNSVIEDVTTFHLGTGNLDGIKYCNSLKSLVMQKANNTITGSASNLPANLEVFNVCRDDGNNAGNSIKWSFDDFASKPKLKYICVRGQECTGGDFHSMLVNRTGDADLNFCAINCPVSGDVMFDYTSGATGALPSETLNIKRITFNRAGTPGYDTIEFDKASCLGFLNFIKDGMDANKITFASEPVVVIRGKSGVSADSEVTALVTTLAASPYNVSITVN